MVASNADLVIIPNKLFLLTIYFIFTSFIIKGRQIMMSFFYRRHHSPRHASKLWQIPKRSAMIIGLAFVLFLSSTGSVYALRIASQNVQAIAVYDPTRGQVHTLAPEQIVYNITSPSLISMLIEGIDFVHELDCSDIGSLPNALVFISFKDGSVGRYQVVNLWSNFSAYGFSSCCFAVSPEAQTLLHQSAQ